MQQVGYTAHWNDCNGTDAHGQTGKIMESVRLRHVREKKKVFVIDYK